MGSRGYFIVQYHLVYRMLNGKSKTCGVFSQNCIILFLADPKRVESYFWDTIEDSDEVCYRENLKVV